MVGDDFWNFWWDFLTFCENLQNICPLAANLDQMDKNGYDFWLSAPKTRKSVTNIKSPKILYTGVIVS